MSNKPVAVPIIPDTNVLCCWLVRSIINDEALAVVGYDHSPAFNTALVKKLDKAFGWENWWFDGITRAEFETYKEFGFRILELEPYEL